MSAEKLAVLLAAMQGARFDEFVIRKASARLAFSKNLQGRQVHFNVETNCTICETESSASLSGDDIASAAKILFDALELNLATVEKVSPSVFRFEFENGAAFCLADLERLWDNVFSVRTVDWPERGSSECYFFC